MALWDTFAQGKDKATRIRFRGRNSAGKTTYCGLTCTNWSFVLMFFLAFYTCLGLITVGFYFVFKTMIIDDTANIPYRQGFVIPNSKIDKKNMTDIPKFIQFDRAINTNLNRDLYLPSKLDYPFLTHVPNRYGSDDDDSAQERSRRYKAQLSAYQREYPYDEEPDDEFSMRCDDLNFAEKRVAKKGNFSDEISFMKSSCWFDRDDWFRKDGRTFCDWYDIRGPDKNETFEPEDDPSVVCVLIKLNNVVGFFPQPMGQVAIEEEIRKLKSDGLMVVAKHLLTNHTAIDDLTLMKILCWHDSKSHPDLLDFAPGPWIHVKHFPFTGQETYTQPAVMMRLNFRREPPVNGMVRVNCRAMANNIDYYKKVYIMQSRRYGHFEMKIQYVSGGRNDRKVRFKIETIGPA